MYRIAGVGVVALSLTLASCGGRSATKQAQAGSAQTAGFACNDAQFLKDRSAFFAGQLASDVEVDVCGKVTRVLRARRTASGVHGYFYVRVGPNDTVRIVSNLDEMNAPAWPWVQRGDQVYVQGRYYFDNPQSQGIDWTHHGASRSWAYPGYVVVNGTKYQ